MEPMTFTLPTSRLYRRSHRPLQRSQEGGREGGPTPRRSRHHRQGEARYGRVRRRRSISSPPGRSGLPSGYEPARRSPVAGPAECDGHENREASPAASRDPSGGPRGRQAVAEEAMALMCIRQLWTRSRSRSGASTQTDRDQNSTCRILLSRTIPGPGIFLRASLAQTPVTRRLWKL